MPEGCCEAAPDLRSCDCCPKLPLSAVPDTHTRPPGVFAQRIQAFSGSLASHARLSACCEITHRLSDFHLPTPPLGKGTILEHNLNTVTGQRLPEYLSRPSATGLNH